jgi:hypothetical protein
MGTETPARPDPDALIGRLGVRWSIPLVARRIRRDLVDEMTPTTTSSDTARANAPAVGLIRLRRLPNGCSARCRRSSLTGSRKRQGVIEDVPGIGAWWGGWRSSYDRALFATAKRVGHPLLSETRPLNPSGLRFGAGGSGLASDLRVAGVGDRVQREPDQPGSDDAEQERSVGAVKTFRCVTSARSVVLWRRRAIRTCCWG